MKSEHNIVPDFSHWKIYQNQWASNNAIIASTEKGIHPLMLSPDFTLEGGRYYTISLEYSTKQPTQSIFQIFDAKSRRIKKERQNIGRGHSSISIGFYVPKDCCYKLKFSTVASKAKKLELNDLNIKSSVFETFDPDYARTDTTLPHWGFFKKNIHNICKRSKHFNILISYIEMHLKREEVVSLPSYMALCPTGQCNATCLFCSVAGNREGIIKKGMPVDAIRKLISQIDSTVWMYGIEGNGEPLLFKHIDKLIATILSKKSNLYLITNGSLLNQRLLYLLLSEQVDSINFSLNAATPETHYRIMGLTNFNEITTNIRKLSDLRGQSFNPFLSVSLVVTRDNVHEVADFIALADKMKVDRAYIRPLSELATEAGSVEDDRDIVPFENDIANLTADIDQYIHDANPGVEVVYDPTSFHAVRQDPLNGIIPINGFEDRIIVPPRQYWRYEIKNLKTYWFLKNLRITWLEDTSNGIVCGPVPVQNQVNLTFSCRLKIYLGSVIISIIGENGQKLGKGHYTYQKDENTQMVSINLNTRENNSLRVSINGSKGTKALVEFDHMKSHPQKIDRSKLLKNIDRWEINNEGLVFQYKEPRIRLKWEGIKYTYLFKSYAIPCTQNESISIFSFLHVHGGEVGIGILDQSSQDWIKTACFKIGKHDVSINFNSESNETFRIVLYSTSDQPMDVELEWRGFKSDSVEKIGSAQENKIDINIDSDYPEDSQVSKNRHESTSVSYIAESAGAAETDPNSKSKKIKLKQRIREYFISRPKVYCQKPWTDLNNFSVDGRMDVCCITTGESQKRYALGNLYNHDFQAIWNGPVAKKFRRTVNLAEHRLPPCARCPMAYQEQGLFFSLGSTKAYTKQLIKYSLRFRASNMLNAIVSSAKRHIS